MSATDPTAPEPPHPEAALDPATGRLLDELAANATVAPFTRLVDGWLCKAAPALPFRRANAVLPPPGVGDDSRSASASLDAIESWYRQLDQRVLIQVSSADPSSTGLDDLLDQRGYLVEAPVDLLVAETDADVDAGGPAADALRVAVEERAMTATGSASELGGPAADPDIDVVVTEGVDEEWAERYGSLLGEDEVWRARTEAYGRMLGGLGPAVLGGALTIGDDLAGVGFAVLERGWAGIYGMGTAPAWRQKGVARALLGGLAVEARHRHGTHLYLQVEVDNPDAQALYRGMGFTPSHGYHYRVSSPPALTSAPPANLDSGQ